MRRWTIVMLLAGLTGCTTAAQQQAANAAADQRACQSAGKTPGTEAFRQCVAGRAQQREQANRDFLRAAVAGPEMTPLGVMP